jgi:hypothetical protein
MYKHQPLRIYPDWQVLYNQFYEIDEINQENIDWVDTDYQLKLYSKERNQFIAMWWTPTLDINGYYHIEVRHALEVYSHKTKNIELKFEKIHTVFDSRNRLDIVEKLEEDLMWKLPHYDDPRILKRPGVVDEPSESYRIDLKDNGFNKKLIDDILLNGNKKVQHIALKHLDLNRNIILRFKEESPFLKVQKRAEHLLTNKKYNL